MKEELTKIFEEQQKTVNEIKEKTPYPDLKSYYLNVYQEMYQHIVSDRVQEINGVLKDLDNEIENIKNTVAKIDEDVKTNEEISLKINSIEEKVYESYALLEEKRFKSETIQDKVEQETIKYCNMHHELIGRYINIFNNYLNGLITNGELIESIEELRSCCLNEAFEISLKIKENERKIISIKKDIEDEIKSTRKSIDVLIKDKERYETYLYEVETSKQKTLIDELQLRINHQQTYLKDIEQEYVKLCQLQLKEFNDIYSKNYLINKPTDEQVNEYDALFKKFKTKLLSLDTKANLEYQRSKRLNSLNQEKERLDVYKKQKEEIDLKISKYTEASLIVENNINELIKHVEDIKDEISTYKYQQFVRIDDQFNNEMNYLKNTIAIEQEQLNSLKEEKTYYLFEPNIEKLKEVDQLILDKEKSFNELIKRDLELEKDYLDFLNQNNNKRIKELLDEGKYFDGIIPTLQEKLDKLKEKITNFKNESNTLKDDLINYQDILMQIEELNHEDLN